MDKLIAYASGSESGNESDSSMNEPV